MALLGNAVESVLRRFMMSFESTSSYDGLRQKMATLTDEDLYAVLYIHNDEYTAEAISAASDEYNRRKVILTERNRSWLLSLSREQLLELMLQSDTGIDMQDADGLVKLVFTSIEEWQNNPREKDAIIQRIAEHLTITSKIFDVEHLTILSKIFDFDVHLPNAKTIAAMREARTGNLENFDSVKALMADLNAEG